MFKINLPMTYRLKTPRLQQEKIHRFIVRVGSVLTSYKQPKIAKLIGVSAVANVVTSPNIRPCICSGICSPNQLKNGTFTKFEIPERIKLVTIIKPNVKTYFSNTKGTIPNTNKHKAIPIMAPQTFCKGYLLAFI